MSCQRSIPRRCSSRLSVWAALLSALLLNAASPAHPTAWFHQASSGTALAPEELHLEAAAGGTRRASAAAATLCAVCLTLATARAGLANLPELRARHLPAQCHGHAPTADASVPLSPTGALPAPRAPPHIA